MVKQMNLLPLEVVTSGLRFALDQHGCGTAEKQEASDMKLSSPKWLAILALSAAVGCAKSSSTRNNDQSVRIDAGSRSIRLTQYFEPQVVVSNLNGAVPDGREVSVRSLGAESLGQVLVRPQAALDGVGLFLANETTILTSYGDQIPDLAYVLTVERLDDGYRVVGTADSGTLNMTRISSREPRSSAELENGEEMVFQKPLIPDLSYEWVAANGQRGKGLLVVSPSSTSEMTSIVHNAIRGDFAPPVFYEWRENNRKAFGPPEATNVLLIAPDRSNPLYQDRLGIPPGVVSYYKAEGDAIPALPYRLRTESDGSLVAETALGQVDINSCGNGKLCYTWKTSEGEGKGQLVRLTQDVGTVRVRAGEPTVLTAHLERAPLPGDVLEWHAEHGTILGEGQRIGYVPATDFSGMDRVRFLVKRGKLIVEERLFRLPVSPIRKRLIVTEVLRQDGHIVMRGRAENIADPGLFKVAAYFHEDVYYPVSQNHVLPLQPDGRFVFEAKAGPEVDRVVLHLIRDNVDPDDEQHCQNPWRSPPVPGQCTGVFDFFYNSKARVPLEINDTDSLAFVSFPLEEESKQADPQLAFLERRISKTRLLYRGTPTNSGEIEPDPSAPPGARLLRSYDHHDQVYLYDIALGIMAFVHAGEQKHAKSLLDGLKYLQIDGSEKGRKDGSWYFSYDPDGRTIYPLAASWHTNGVWDRYDYSDRRVSGAIAWAAMAVASYRLKYPEDSSYNDMLFGVVEYLERNLIDLEYAGIKSRPLRFQDGDRASTGDWDESKTVAVEHNLDAYAVFRMVAKITNDSKYIERADGIRSFVQSMWDEPDGRFYPGHGNSDGANTTDIFMDPQSWGLLSMGHDPSFLSRYSRGLEYNYNNFFEPLGALTRVTSEGVTVSALPGFFDHYRAGQDILDGAHQLVWTEGTLGMIMAMQMVEKATGEREQFTRYGVSYDAHKLLALMNQYQDERGGVSYATWNAVRDDLSHDPSIAGVAWLYFANHGFNPFDPDFGDKQANKTPYEGPGKYEIDVSSTEDNASRKRLHFVPSEVRLVDDFDEGPVRTTPDKRTTSLSRELGLSTVFHGTFSHRPNFVDMTKIHTRNEAEEETGLALKLDYDVTSAGWAGYYSLLGGIDISGYDALTFLVRGKEGGETFTIGLTDQTRVQYDIGGINLGSVDLFLQGGITTEWKEVVVPLAPLKELGATKVDLRQVGGLLFELSQHLKGTVFVDDIAFKKGQWSLVDGGSVPTPDHGADRVIDPDDESVIEGRLQPGEIGAYGYTLSEEIESSEAKITLVSGGLSNTTYAIQYNKVKDPASVAGVFIGVSRDLRPFNGVEFFVRGDGRAHTFDIGFLDIIADNRQDGVLGGSIHRYLENGINTEWQLVRIPLSDFRALDFSRMVSLIFNFSDEGEGTFWVRGLRFIDDLDFDPKDDLPALHVDDFNYSDQNLLGHFTGVYNRLPSLCTAERLEKPDDEKDVVGTDKMLSVNYQRDTEGWCGYYSRLASVEGDPLRLSEYNAVSFQVKGATGGERFQVKIADAEHDVGGISVPVADVTDLLEGGVTDEWQTVVAPLGALAKTGQVDLTRLVTIVLDFHATGNGTVYIDDLKFVAVPEEPEIPKVVVDDYSEADRNSLGHFKGVFSQAPTSCSATHVPDSPTSGPMMRFAYDRKTQGFCGYVSRLNEEAKEGIDVSKHGSLSFRVRGEAGGERFQVRLADLDHQATETSVALGDVGAFIQGGVSTEWQTVRISLAPFAEVLDLTQMASVALEVRHVAEGAVYIDDIEFVDEPGKVIEEIDTSVFLVDDFELGPLNRLGQANNTFSGAPSSCVAYRISETLLTGEVLQIDYDQKDTGWCGYYSRMNPDDSPLDVSGFGALTLKVRGASGQERFQIYLADNEDQQQDSSRLLGDIGEFLEGGVTEQWQTVTIPLTLIDTEFDTGKMGTIIVQFDEPGQGTIYLDDIGFAR